MHLSVISVSIFSLSVYIYRAKKRETVMAMMHFFIVVKKELVFLSHRNQVNVMNHILLRHTFCTLPFKSAHNVLHQVAVAQ